MSVNYINRRLPDWQPLYTRPSVTPKAWFEHYTRRLESQIEKPKHYLRYRMVDFRHSGPLVFHKRIYYLSETTEGESRAAKKCFVEMVGHVPLPEAHGSAILRDRPFRGVDKRTTEKLKVRVGKKK